jgi:glycosyltransferase involved in cell wall biosynthesis
MSTEQFKFSILIPSWNNLDYLKLCIDSIRRNSYFSHQILVHVNVGSDGTPEWLKANGIQFTQSAENIGVCWAVNSLRPLVNTDYIVYMNDDMYVCPDWDLYLFKEIRSLPDNKFFLSSTLLQPRPFFCSSVIAPADFGTSVSSFRKRDLLDSFKSFKHADWCGATWPPNIVHRDLWDLVGGYSVEFSPGMYSDPDFAAKLYKAGVRYFKGISASRVYHFEQVSTGRVSKNKGSLQFLRKWGITSASFMRDVLHRGEPWNESLMLEGSHSFGRDKLRSRFKMFLTSFRHPLDRDLWE